MSKEEDFFKENFPEYVTEKGEFLTPYWDLFRAGVICATFECKVKIEQLEKENAELDCQRSRTILEEGVTMEFDKSKVYTAVNADELKVGSKVIVAKNIHALRDLFCENQICTLIEVYSEDYQDRFCAKFDSDGMKVTTTLAYLVSEPEEKKLKWTDLKIGDVIRSKEANTITRMVTGIDTAENHEHIEIGGYWLRDNDIEQWEKV